MWARARATQSKNAPPPPNPPKSRALEKKQNPSLPLHLGNLLAASAAASLHASAAPSPPLSRKGSWLDVRVHAAAGSSPGGGEAAGPPPTAAALASLAPVLAVVGVASLGAFAFGYHLAVVNGPLDAMAASLGFAGDSAKQGLVVSTLLAGAAAGSLAGSAAADALGRRGGWSPPPRRSPWARPPARPRPACPPCSWAGPWRGWASAWRPPWFRCTSRRWPPPACGARSGRSTSW